MVWIWNTLGFILSTGIESQQKEAHLLLYKYMYTSFKQLMQQKIERRTNNKTKLNL